MRQPTVSEDPNKPGITRENQFWFHWRQMSYKFWPFVHGFLNLIVSGTTLAAFKIFTLTWQNCFQYPTWWHYGRSSVLMV
jgi:hypothetical protein